MIMVNGNGDHNDASMRYCLSYHRVWHGMLWHTLPCYRVECHAVLCSAVPCHAIRCLVMPYDTKVVNSLLCLAMPCSCKDTVPRIQQKDIPAPAPHLEETSAVDKDPEALAACTSYDILLAVQCGIVLYQYGYTGRLVCEYTIEIEYT